MVSKSRVCKEAHGAGCATVGRKGELNSVLTFMEVAAEHLQVASLAYATRVKQSIGVLALGRNLCAAFARVTQSAHVASVHALVLVWTGSCILDGTGSPLFGHFCFLNSFCNTVQPLYNGHWTLSLAVSLVV